MHVKHKRQTEPLEDGKTYSAVQEPVSILVIKFKCNYKQNKDKSVIHFVPSDLP